MATRRHYTRKTTQPPPRRSARSEEPNYYPVRAASHTVSAFKRTSRRFSLSFINFQQSLSSTSPQYVRIDGPMLNGGALRIKVRSTAINTNGILLIDIEPECSGVGLGVQVVEGPMVRVDVSPTVQPTEVGVVTIVDQIVSCIALDGIESLCRERVVSHVSAIDRFSAMRKHCIKRCLGSRVTIDH